jgi:hypothetical protein
MQLVWSRGLADQLSVGKLFSDSELANMDPVDDVEPAKILRLDTDTWALIVKTESRALVLALAVRCKHELEGFLDRLRSEVPLLWMQDDMRVSAIGQPKLRR